MGPMPKPKQRKKPRVGKKNNNPGARAHTKYIGLKKKKKKKKFMILLGNIH